MKGRFALFAALVMAVAFPAKAQQELAPPKAGPCSAAK